MRVRRRFGVLRALLVVITLGVGALPPPAGAQTSTTIEAGTPGTLPDGDDVPSCSLFPTRLGLGQWQFTNRRDFTITLQIITTSVGGLTGPVGTEIIVFDGTLAGGESTPVFTLTPDTVIHWAGGTYHVSAYDLVNCLEEEGPLLTVPTTAPPSTTPFSVPPEPTTTTTAPPPGDVEPSSTTTTAAALQEVVVESTTATTIPVRLLAATGPGLGLGFAVLVAVTLVLFGLAGLAIARHRDAERWGEELGS